VSDSSHRDARPTAHCALRVMLARLMQQIVLHATGDTSVDSHRQALPTIGPDVAVAHDGYCSFLSPIMGLL
jgi:hypothetical protein